ncbi:hypothetical protein LTR56_016137 [Elasticomyces elasticus]|nr:hypothetical protein LTR56_016137 [Elasticomyces elasticus]KAK3637919.1 hypothetical protein LTR22_018057 [Elasticomyces elasticus]KAK4918308.1 hypothetical protein LTR49_013858 [Elasticomyces elasticus]KAK5762742.1 hypothetical protein LTS12_007131 [Elasticomyces elasticus]
MPGNYPNWIFDDPAIQKTAMDALNDLNGPEDTNKRDSYAYDGIIPKHLTSTASPPVCFKNCKVCRGQYRSITTQKSLLGRKYNGQCTDAEAAKVITDHIKDTIGKLAEVRQLLQDHGNTIKKRFEKRSPQKRADLIRAAMPDMYPIKWLEAYYVFDEFGEDKADTQYRHLERASRRKCWLLPYLNIETLSNDPTKLLVLLHLRSNYRLEDFLPYDVERTKMGFEDHHLKIKYNPHAVVMCSEAGVVGTLTRWNQQAAHRGDVVGFPRAQLAFEAVNELATFLRKFVQVTLSTGPCDQPQGRFNFDATVEESLEASSQGRSSYNERAFSRPVVRNLKYLRDTMDATIKSTFDELWLLQTDPIYFRDKMATIEASGFHRGLTGRQKGENILRYIREAVGQVEYALQVERSLNVCFPCFDALGSQVRRGQPLPAAYDGALGCIQSCIKGYYRSYNEGMLSRLGQLPTFEERFEWVDGKHVPIDRSGNGGHRKDPLYWNFSQIAIPSHMQSVMLDRSFHLHYIDDILQSPKERSRVDQAMYDHYSQMLALNEAEVVLASHLPRSTVGSDWATENVPLPLREVKLCKTGKLSDLLSGFLTAPVPTAKPTAENLLRLKKMHLTAGCFWDGLASAWVELIPPQYRLFIEKHIRAYQSEEYAAGYEEETARWQAAIDQKEFAVRARATPAFRQMPPVSSVQKVWGKETLSLKTSPQRKAKVKSRAEAVDESVAQLADMQLEDGDEVMAQGFIAVGKDSKMVFARMFSPSVETKGLLKWDQLTAAFVDAGLSMVPNGGSRVIFTHPDPQKGSIVFHRPHPDPSVNVIMLRCMAKRLGKWFGWEAGTFM